MAPTVSVNFRGRTNAGESSRERTEGKIMTVFWKAKETKGKKQPGKKASESRIKSETPAHETGANCRLTTFVYQYLPMK
jgi:hypothetical protein